MLCNRRDAVIVRRLGFQSGEHRLDEDLAAAFQEIPIDVLRGIIEYKRVEDGLEVNLSMTSARWTEMCSLWRRPDHSRLPRYSWSPSNE